MRTESPDDIVVIDRPIDVELLRGLVDRFFGDMVKLVIDVDQRLVAVGGELHADAEAILLGRGCRQADLWGANYYPGLGPDECIQFTALINIRPSQDNRAMEVQDPAIRNAMRAIVHGYGRVAVSRPSQHSGLSPERWATFGYDQQILMIANEVHRTARVIELGSWDRVHAGLERVLQLTNLTIACASSPTRRRELLRWRDLVAALYVQQRPDPGLHESMFRCLLQFTPAAFPQTALLFGGPFQGSPDLRAG